MVHREHWQVSHVWLGLDNIYNTQREILMASVSTKVGMLSSLAYQDFVIGGNNLFSLRSGQTSLYYRWHTVNIGQWPALTCAGGRGGAVVLHEDLAVPDVLAVLQLVPGDVDHQPVQPLSSLRVLPAGRVGVHHGQRVHLQTLE